MDNGERRTVQRRDGNRFQVGDRVTMNSGQLELMYPR
jgi:outer membrane lipoprotein SlyB